MIAEIFLYLIFGIISFLALFFVLFLFLFNFYGFKILYHIFFKEKKNRFSKSISAMFFDYSWTKDKKVIGMFNKSRLYFKYMVYSWISAFVIMLLLSVVLRVFF